MIGIDEMAALDTPIVIADAAVYYNIDDTNPAANLTNSFNDNIILGKKEVEQLNCKLFNETLSTKPREMNGGFYDFVLSNNLVIVFIKRYLMNVPCYIIKNYDSPSK